jgi:hypothetical protein
MNAVKGMGVWDISAVDTSGDVGQFASLSLDTSDIPHISYYQHLADRTGFVKFARWNGLGWDITNIDTLENVFIGFAGARNMTSLVLDSQGKPHVSYGDEKVLKYAVLDDLIWQIEVVLDVSGLATILGQLTSLELDAQGEPHIAYHEVITKSPLTGTVKYATRNVVTSIHQEAINPKKFELIQNYPNPFNPTTKISYSISNPSLVILKVYDALGREIQTIVSEFQERGEYSIIFDASKLASGIYFYKLQVGHDSVETKKMLFLR